MPNYQALVKMFRDPNFMERYFVDEKTEDVKTEQQKFMFYGHKTTFSNFSPHPVKAYGRTWPSTEHLFQALKFKTTDEKYFEQIANCDTPSKAKKLGRSRAHPLRADWEHVKDDVMLYCIQLKVLQNSEVEVALRQTGEMELVEDAPTDYYWGCGKTGTGRNQLGKTYMQVREMVLAGTLTHPGDNKDFTLATIKMGQTDHLYKDELKNMKFNTTGLRLDCKQFYPQELVYELMIPATLLKKVEGLKKIHKMIDGSKDCGLLTR